MSHTCLDTECGLIPAGIIDEIAAGEASGQSYADFGLHKNAGLHQIICRRAQRAGIRTPGLHSLRLTFALSCLRNVMDIF